jgi:hypothetical protein
MRTVLADTIPILGERRTNQLRTTPTQRIIHAGDLFYIKKLDAPHFSCIVSLVTTNHPYEQSIQRNYWTGKSQAPTVVLSGRIQS